MRILFPEIWGYLAYNSFYFGCKRTNLSGMYKENQFERSYKHIIEICPVGMILVARSESSTVNSSQPNSSQAELIACHIHRKSFSVLCKNFIMYRGVGKGGGEVKGVKAPLPLGPPGQWHWRTYFNFPWEFYIFAIPLRRKSDVRPHTQDGEPRYLINRKGKITGFGDGCRQ